MNELIDVKDLYFTLSDEHGNQIKCDILYEATDEVNGKAYIAYTDYVKDETGKFRIIIAELISENDGYRVVPIDDQEIQNSIFREVSKMFNEQK